MSKEDHDRLVEDVTEGKDRAEEVRMDRIEKPQFLSNNSMDHLQILDTLEIDSTELVLILASKLVYRIYQEEGEAALYQEFTTKLTVPGFDKFIVEKVGGVDTGLKLKVQRSTVSNLHVGFGKG